jgi:hypothetical protein
MVDWVGWVWEGVKGHCVNRIDCLLVEESHGYGASGMVSVV